MRRTTWERLGVAGPATLAWAGILVFGTAAVASAQSAESAGGALQGTWVVTVGLYNCETGAQVGGPFKSLLTFSQGGTMTETTSNPMFFPTVRGPGHGIWTFSEDGTYRATTLAFITLNGVLTMTEQITQKIEFGDDRNQFHTTEAHVQFFDPQGNEIRAGCAAAVGQRLEQ